MHTIPRAIRQAGGSSSLGRALTRTGTTHNRPLPLNRNENIGITRRGIRHFARSARGSGTCGGKAVNGASAASPASGRSSSPSNKNQNREISSSAKTSSSVDVERSANSCTSTSASAFSAATCGSASAYAGQHEFYSSAEYPEAGVGSGSECLVNTDASSATNTQTNAASSEQLRAKTGSTDASESSLRHNDTKSPSRTVTTATTVTTSDSASRRVKRRTEALSKPLNLDSFGRKHTYLRVSLTDKCNLRCTYCMPDEDMEAAPREELLTTPELRSTLRVMVEDVGVTKIRLTGGEPTLRRDFGDILRVLGELNHGRGRKLSGETCESAGGSANYVGNTADAENISSSESSQAEDSISRTEELIAEAISEYEKNGSVAGYAKTGATSQTDNITDSMSNSNTVITQFANSIPPSSHKLQLGMTTNGLLVSRYLKALKAAGVVNLNFSLDTLSEDKFPWISKRPQKWYQKIRKNLEEVIADPAFRVKVNVVLMRGVNEEEVEQFVEFTRERDVEVRFIEYMPFQQNGWSEHRMVTKKEILKCIEYGEKVEGRKAVMAKEERKEKEKKSEQEQVVIEQAEEQKKLVKQSAIAGGGVEAIQSEAVNQSESYNSESSSYNSGPQTSSETNHVKTPTRTIIPVFQGLHETAQVWRVAGHRGTIGVISSMTDQFCGGCNRLRLTADGQLKNCLFGVEEFDLRKILREEKSDITNTINNAGGSENESESSTENEAYTSETAPNTVTAKPSCSGATATTDSLIEKVQECLKKKHFKLGGKKDMHELRDSDVANRPMISIGG